MVLKKDMPIQQKIMTAILLTSGAVSLITCLSFFAYEYITFRQSLVSQLTSFGDIVAYNSTASLAFNDQESAAEILSSLKAKESLVTAALYDNKGNLFAKYPDTVPESELPVKPDSTSYHFSGNYLIGFQPVSEGGINYGMLYLKSDMRTMDARLRLYGLIVVVIISFSFILAFILSKRLQQRISKPILALAKTAGAVSERQDYSVRAEKMSNDEVGALTEAFNHMLVQIEKQNTEIVRFNTKLKQNRQELQNIMDRSVDVICTIDAEGKFVKVSAAAISIWGYAPEELIGQCTDSFLLEEDIARSAEVRQAVKDGVKLTNFENQYVRKDGRIVPVIWSANWDETEQVMYCVGRDATMLKEAEFQLQKHAAELAASNKELEQFAYIASHDLQEPLRMVTSFLTQLQKKYKDQLDDKATQYIHFAVDGAARMRRIILDLLEYSRVGKNVGIEEVDINALLQEVTSLNHTLITEKNAKVTWTDMPVVQTAKTALQQVFHNLIGNALKYHDGLTTPQVAIKAEEHKKYWQFSVTDNGIGIDPQFFDKIFLVFQRLHANSEYSGSGIGLAICKKIIESQGGQIWVESAIDEGSTFNFTILKESKSVT